MKDLSILNNKETILYPNSEFERRVILQYYLDNDIEISDLEKDILLAANVSEPESIGIIGCLLKDKSYLNSLRLAIGASNTSNLKLSELSNSLLDFKQLEKAKSFYFIEKDYNDLTDIEKIIRREFNIL